MTAAQTGLIPDPRVSQGCREQVWLLLKDYPIEEVQAALNSLVANPKWLVEHRRAAYTGQKTSGEQTATQEPIVRLVIRQDPLPPLRYESYVRFSID